MKALFIIVVALGLNSCNTLIGLGRDTKQGYQWTRAKIQESNQPNAYDAPVY